MRVLAEMKKGTVVKFWDGRVAVKRVTGDWEVSGTVLLRRSDSDLEDHVVLWVPPVDVSGYGLGTILRVGDEAFMKTSHRTPGGGGWSGISGVWLEDAQIEASDFIELFVTT